jgi:glycosyltransferase involved in cell wall biosynthesis
MNPAGGSPVKPDSKQRSGLGGGSAMMEQLPLVSVVVPVFNGEATIAACIDSLMGSDYPAGRFEVVVVDNRSTDRTAAILAGYGERIVLTREATRGPAAARNRGVRAASGEIVAFTDADCTVDPDWLIRLTGPLNDPSVGIVGGRILSRRPCNAVELFGETIHDHSKAIGVFKPPYVISMNWASRRSVLVDAGLFDEAFLRCEDVDLSQRILRLGYRIVYAPAAVVYHRNEDSLAGLFREGFQHGVWSVRHNREHHEFNLQFGHRRLNPRSYRAIGTNLWAALRGIRRPDALCQAIFDVGKKCGKITGSVRFGYIDL